MFRSLNKPVKDYDDLVLQIKKGDRIYFSNGKYFEIDQRIGVGGTTMIFSNNRQPNVAIRIAKSSQWTTFIKFTNAGYDLLKSNDVESVKVLAGYGNEFSIIEKINQHQTLYDFISEANTFYQKSMLAQLTKRTEKNEIKNKLSKLEDFILSSFQFESIADLHDKNLIYDFQNKKWTVMDWSYPHRMLTNYDSQKSTIDSLLIKYIQRIERIYYPKSKKYIWILNWANQVNEKMQFKRSKICQKVFYN